ncbi:MAG: 5-deoxy-glucuronate isomerase, partial [Acidipropionibacterium jensenii]
MSDYVLPAGTAGHDEFEVDVSPQRAGWTYSGLRVATLAAGSSTTVETGEYEYLVLPLEGSWRVEVDGRTTELAGRRTIWGQVTDYFFLPRGTTAVVTAVSGGRVGLPYALASEDLEPRYCPVDEVTVELRGADYLCRQASSYSVGNALHTSRLLVVEVITPGGCWSSYPPHKHDEEGPDEHELEEIYY